MPRATGVASLFSSPLHPHEPEDDLGHTPKRKGSSKEGFFHILQKITQSFSHTVTAADWEGPSGQCNVQVPFSCPLPPPGTRFWGGLGSRSFARVLPWELFSPRSAMRIYTIYKMKTKAASIGSRCCHKHLGLSPASGAYYYDAICSLCWFPFIHLLPL